MFYIGIDFSVNYPAVCICEDFKKFRWIACVNTSQTKKFKKTLDDFNNPELEFIFIESKQKKTEHYYLTERNKLNNQIEVVSSLVAKIESYVKQSPVIIGIEGYSYGSAGNSLIDIVQSTGILKSYIFNRLAKTSVDNMFIFSPSELKNAIGAKGNCGKIDVFTHFIEDPIIPEVRLSPLYQFIQQHKDEIFNGKEVKSPIMDMVDSYLPILKFKQIMQ